MVTFEDSNQANNNMLTHHMKYCLIGFLMLLISDLAAQDKSESENLKSIISGNFTYSFHRPSRDMAVRFGNSLEIGIGSDYITKKNKFILGVSATLLFGNTVNEDVLTTITNDNGNVIGTDQTVSVINLKQRGFYMGGHVGKIFRLSKSTMSGIRLTLGAGLLQHKIRVQDNLQNVNILKGENIKGFDRLTNGLSFHQFLGYQHFGKSGLFNVFGGVEAYEGYTMSRRSFDNTLMRKDDEKRFDVLLGLKIGIMIKFNLDENPNDIYY